MFYYPLGESFYYSPCETHTSFLRTLRIYLPIPTLILHFGIAPNSREAIDAKIFGCPKQFIEFVLPDEFFLLNSRDVDNAKILSTIINI